MKKIILSSTSISRKELFTRLMLPFITIAPNINETPLPQETPLQLVRRLAQAKAKVHAHQFPDALIIGSDQVIVLNNEIIGKPKDHADAARQLKQSSGQRLTSLTGLCLLNTKTQLSQIEVETFYVQMRVLTDEMIENYLQKDKPYHCAGSIKAESLGVCLFEHLEGHDPSALTGLPLITLVRLLESEGVHIV